MKDAKKVLIVDDSKLVRKGLIDIFERDARFQIVGEAANGAEALAAVEQFNPDVITLDVMMPFMDGLTALKHLMIKMPTPTVMLSSLTLDGAEITFDTLRYGALDFIPKPSRLDPESFKKQTQDIVEKTLFAAAVNVAVVSYIRTRPVDVLPGSLAGRSCERVVTLGAAEGGYGALLKIIPQLRPEPTTAYLVVLYTNPKHLDAFAAYLNQHSLITVKCVQHNEVLEPGVCYLSSGADYTTLHRQRGAPVLHVSPAPFSSRKGAIDMLMFSVADVMETACSAVVLSGSGTDGAEGLEEIMRVGGKAMIQDPKTCLCRDMALAALARCQLEHAMTDLQIASKINDLATWEI